MITRLFPRTNTVTARELELTAEVERLRNETERLRSEITAEVGSPYARALERRVDSLEAECLQLAETAGQLRHALSVARRPAPGADSTAPPRTCPQCHGPMPAGFAHWCPRRSGYDTAVA